jgi:hypothetical protein
LLECRRIVPASRCRPASASLSLPIDPDRIGACSESRYDPGCQTVSGGRTDNEHVARALDRRLLLNVLYLLHHLLGTALRVRGRANKASCSGFDNHFEVNSFRSSNAILNCVYRNALFLF